MSFIRMGASFVRRNFGGLALALMLVVSLTVNVVLAKRLFQSPTVERFVDPIGSALPPVTVRSMDGMQLQLRFPGPRTKVLYYLSPECSWCNRNHENIVALANNASGRFEFVGIALAKELGPISSYLSSHPLPFPVYATEDVAWLKSAGLIGTPATLVIDVTGTVQERFRGAYTASRLASVEEFFQVKLPGVGLSNP